MIDPLLASAFVGVGAACALTYLLGRWHGTEATLSYRFPDEMAGDWPRRCAAIFLMFLSMIER